MEHKYKHIQHHAASAKALRTKAQIQINAIEINTANDNTGELEVASTAISSKKLKPHTHNSNSKHKKNKDLSPRGILRANPNSRHKSFKDLQNEVDPLDKESVVNLCNFIAEEFWEEAWDTCSKRFIAQKAPDFITCELRDTWLTVLDMQYLDTEPALLEPITISEPVDDVPPLPPKLDSWSRGVLEPLPRKCRESVLDPFLRDPFLWAMEKFEGKNDELLAKQRMFPLSHIETAGSDDMINKESQEDLNFGETQWEYYETEGRDLVRPTSPVPSDADLDSGWSLISNKNLGISTKGSSERTESSSKQISLEEKKQSVEILHPLKTPMPVIKESLQIQHNMSEGVLWKEGEDKITPLVAFKHPRQTSSDAIKTMTERHTEEEIKRHDAHVKVESTPKRQSSFSRIYTRKPTTMRVSNNTAIPSKLVKSAPTLSQVEPAQLKAKKRIS